jgi:hypothetical protein
MRQPQVVSDWLPYAQVSDLDVKCADWCAIGHRAEGEASENPVPNEAEAQTRARMSCFFSVVDSSQRERFMWPWPQARPKSFFTSRDIGAMWLHHGHSVLSE